MRDELGQAMRDQDDDAALTGEIVHVGEETIGLLLGQSRVWFIEEEDARVLSKRPSDFGPLSDCEGAPGQGAIRVRGDLKLAQDLVLVPAESGATKDEALPAD